MVANATTYIFTIDQSSRNASSLLEFVGEFGFLVSLLIVGIFLVIGILMDIVAAALKLVQVLIRAAVRSRVDPMHFLFSISAPLAVHLALLPIATCFFAAAYVSRLPMRRFLAAALPFYAINIFVPIAVAACPRISLRPIHLLT